VYVDAALGGAGHSLLIAQLLGPGGRLLCFDRDADAVANARQRLAPYMDKITLINANHADIGPRLTEAGVDNIDGILFDFGVSSYQIDNPARGFSYTQDAPLDMRMDASAPLTARDVVNNYSYEELRRVIWEYGEEKFAPLITKRICERRAQAPIETTGQLSSLLRELLDGKGYNAGHPAKKTFQAIRIEVNGELSSIRPALDAALALLNLGGRVVTLTFHSLEDRAVKTAFAHYAKDCLCPPALPVCACNKRAEMKILTKKPLLPSRDELASNPRSGSAKLRAAEKT